ncbi:MAG: UDP-N-acetylmuramoyl-L-alanine--D-glutamate ligase [Proteobacteria bacterium]|nr:UDP-N-acetylmuramoyl-L-alanine--D-glutamate ligase [Pseudomonadota bacterium]MDA0913684.1 UDP-N-acetylmuramoyl-L-alanine--D-glutamate ligase [Pseudomonadota bacterium]MDA1032445.1 UDP-N-acetylmuramoyl-L-alanine--D-glutamate ligase [Pseudomonadota bacterium]
MITAKAFSGKTYAVLGLARSGAATVETLLASGARVVAWDRQDVARVPFEGRCELADPLEMDLTGFDGVVVSPGVPLNTHPIKPHAEKFGVPVIGDIELFALARAELPPHKVVGITGTNGKSTTTALVYHILKTAGVPTTMGGNIGLPILAQDSLPEGGFYVLELSSYQIDLTYSLHCDVAVLLNITPDHLDRYDGSFEKYAASKFRLFRMQSHEHFGVIADSDSVLRDMRLALVKGPGEWSQPTDGTDLSNYSKSDWPSLQGPHNAQNALAAEIVTVELGVRRDVRREAFRTFTGLPHRMELVTRHEGVIYINDSKATNPDSTAPALAAYPPENSKPRVHWIVGGLPKEDGLGPCEQFLGNIAAAYTIGDAGPRFAELLETHVRVERAEMLQEAVSRAKASAKQGDVVLLSPACASFDQFRDYEARGAAFRQVVAALTDASEEIQSALQAGDAQ